MADHTVTLVPLETWAYHSPQLARTGIHTDLGNLAEALVYYDRVLMNVQHPREVELLVRAFGIEDKIETLVGLLNDGIVRPYHFAFHSTVIGLPDGSFDFVNVQGEDQVSSSSFDLLVLNKAKLDNYLPHARQRKTLLTALRRGVIEVKASSFGATVTNAIKDVQDPKRSVLLVQALAEELPEALGPTGPAEIKATIETAGTKTRTTWNVQLASFADATGDPSFGAHSPAIAAIQANRLIWASATQGSDLFLGSPLSSLVGDKLYEVASRAGKPQDILEELQDQVEFPDVRTLVNAGELPLREVFKLREKAKRFRRWLQEEAERDRSAMFAYLEEAAKDAGWANVGRRVIRAFGWVAAPGATYATKAFVGQYAGEPAATIMGGSAAAATKMLFETISKIGEGWRPMVFGRWAKGRIQKYLDRPKD